MAAGGNVATSVESLVTAKLVALDVPTWTPATFGLAVVPNLDPEIVTE